MVMSNCKYKLNITLNGVEGKLLSNSKDEHVNGFFQIPVDEISLLVIGTMFPRKNHTHFLELTGQNLFSSSYLSAWRFNGDSRIAIYTPLEEIIQRVESLSKIFDNVPKHLHIQEGESITYYLNHYGLNYPSIKLGITKQS